MRRIFRAGDFTTTIARIRRPRIEPGFSDAVRYATAPCWLLASLTGAWPLTSLALFFRRRARVRQRTRAGCCLHCGYDLRATPQSGTATGALSPNCPECGTPR
ncbi:MAG: hypothetical protein JWN40_4915 [Phycisphaerales bacterium]|nr:hypothetical protein [Phycisphaerales bacterium]